MSFHIKNNSDFGSDKKNSQRNDLDTNSQVSSDNKMRLKNQTNAQISSKLCEYNNDDEIADINSKENEKIKDIERYQEYQQNIQDNQPWASTSDIRIVNSDNLPNPNPIMDTEGCPKCGNIQAYWWIVQTDSGDEPSTQFFRCTKCNHTWRNPKTS